METKDTVDINNIIFDVVHEGNDVGFVQFVEGWYKSKVRDAIDELAFDTFFNRLTVDINFPTTNYSIDFPDGAFNIRRIILWNGDCCSPSSSVNVHWKRTMNNRSKGSAYTARVQESTGYDDPYITTHQFTQSMYFYNIQGGKIMFSPNCSEYGHIRIEYDGTTGKIDEEPFIPLIFKKAIRDWVLLEYFRAMTSRDKTFRLNAADKERDLYHVSTGSWTKAEIRAAEMHSAQAEDLREYLSRGNY